MGKQYTTIQLRRDIKANWESKNPVLAEGEVGLISDSPDGEYKIGNGMDNWKTLKVPMILEAPKDGKIYGRKDGKWTEVADMETVIINITTNQPINNDLTGLKFSVKYDNNIIDLDWKEQPITLKIPHATDYTIILPEVKGYRKPADLNFTAESANIRQVSALYQTEIVSVILNTDNAISVEGQKVTINGVVYTYQENKIVHKVPFGTVYSVSVDSKSGFTSPSSKNFTATQSAREVIMTYEEIKLGVYILDTDGGLTTSDKWDTGNNTKAVGVAVVTANCKFVIAPEDSGSNMKWGGYGKTITDIVTTSDANTAKQDYAGETNTDKIISQLKGYNDGYSIGAPAAEYCKNYTFKNGKKGYLGSLGEWQAAYDNKAAVDACISKIGGTAIYTKDDYHRTSTQSSSNQSWLLDWLDGIVFTIPKNHDYRVRAFAAF